MLPKRTKQNVHVIWHHHKQGQLVTLSVKVSQRIHNDHGIRLILQDAGPAPLIQPLINSLGKSIMILTLRFVIPRLRVIRKPDRTFLLPPIQLRFRQRITKAPCYERPSLTLLPMGEVVLGDIDLGPWIKKGGVSWGNGGGTFLSPNVRVERGTGMSPLLWVVFMRALEVVSTHMLICFTRVKGAGAFLPPLPPCRGLENPRAISNSHFTSSPAASQIQDSSDFFYLYRAIADSESLFGVCASLLIVSTFLLYIRGRPLYIVACRLFLERLQHE
jgi:hypothetical protein